VDRELVGQARIGRKTVVRYEGHSNWGGVEGWVVTKAAGHALAQIILEDTRYPGLRKPMKVLQLDKVRHNEQKSAALSRPFVHVYSVSRRLPLDEDYEHMVRHVNRMTAERAAVVLERCAQCRHHIESFPIPDEGTIERILFDAGIGPIYEPEKRNTPFDVGRGDIALSRDQRNVVFTELFHPPRPWSAELNTTLPQFFDRRKLKAFYGRHPETAGRIKLVMAVYGTLMQQLRSGRLDFRKGVKLPFGGIATGK